MDTALDTMIVLSTSDLAAAILKLRLLNGNLPVQNSNLPGWNSIVSPQHRNRRAKRSNP